MQTYSKEQPSAMPQSPSRLPDYESYHVSLSNELFSIKDRVRSLIRHWGTDGEYKEVALRSVLRRHLPEAFTVGRGFIVGAEDSSTQIDVLVIDATKPTLFKDGDLLIVTPDAVRAVIEVKTKLKDTTTFVGTLSKLSAIEDMCRDVTGKDTVWTGLFVYEGQTDLQDRLLRAVGKAYHETKRPIHCVCFGKEVFVRYWERGADVNSPERGPVWHSYELPQVAPSYFVGNLVDWISSVDNDTSNFAWFPVLGGKEKYRRFYLSRGADDPIAC